MDYKKRALELHEKHRGKIEIASKLTLNNKDDLSIAYTPGVAEPCLRIKENTNEVYKYTSKGRLVAVVTDGSAVLGLGNIGAEAALPVMEGKSILFKEFANIDAFPICIRSQNTQEIIETIKNISPVFGGINLEDISSPHCFEIENSLQDIGIPVFHDDQHGTAVVTSAALMNAVKVANKTGDLKVVINGAGAAGIAITKFLLSDELSKQLLIQDIILCDSHGIIYRGRDSLNEPKQEISKIVNKEKIKGSLTDALINADVFIGVSKPNLLDGMMVKKMAENPIIFAMANPTPEIMPNLALKAGAAIIGTGRSDLPNQINNVLAFPGIFKGALDARAKKITNKMKVAAAKAIASCVEPTKNKILPNPLEKEVALKVGRAVELAYLE